MRRTLLSLLGLLLVALGAYVAVRPWLVPGPAVTGSRWLDVGFAVFFVVRGVMNLRASRRLPQAAWRPPAA
ncbi:MAG: hypothetical protein NVS4B3_06460 [Gemmatimonadaceae bacterium]